MQFDYLVPTKILFGKGQPSNLHSQRLPGKKVLVVISSSKSTRSNDYLPRVEMQLDLAGVSRAVFSKVLPNPVKSHTAGDTTLARSEGYNSVVDFSGGSNIGAAKVIAVMATNEGDYWNYISGGSGRRRPVLSDPLSTVAIAMAADTEAEADPWTVTTKEDTNGKIGFGCEETLPVLSIVGPGLMPMVPPHLMAHQDPDALLHSAEGYLAKTADPVSDLFVLKMIELVGKSLTKAVTDRTDKAARADAALTNTLFGMVESLSSCTSEHSLEYMSSTFHHELPHGARLTMINKAHYTHFANTYACDKRITAMAKVLGKTDASSAMDSVQALYGLQSAYGVAELKMSDYGIDGANLERHTDNVEQIMGGLLPADPVRLSGKDNIRISQESFR